MALITDQQVILDLQVDDRTEASRVLGQSLVDAGRVTDLEGFLADIRKREEQMPTGLPGGIGIPHCRSAYVTEPSLAFGRCTRGVDWGAEDGPAHLVFMIAAPDGGGEEHLKILAALARRLMRTDFKEALSTATTPAQVTELISREVG